MKINTKIIAFLVVGFFLISLSFSALSIFSLMNSQKDNLKVFSNEILETTRELVKDDALAFFDLLDSKIKAHSGLSAQDLINIVDDIEPFASHSTLIMDTKNWEMLRGNSQLEMSALLDKRTAQRYLNEMMLTREKSFYLDNYDRFRQDRTASVVPTSAYFRIYDDLGLIVGYGKIMQTTLVRIGFMQKKNADYFRLNLSLFLFIYLLTLIVAVWLSARFIRIFFISPLKQISSVVKQVAKGDLNARASVKIKDEIGDLALAFNEMIQELQKSTTSVEALNKEINDRLKIEEENVRHMKELEVFYKVSMGREERIIELKKEVEKLKKGLGK